MKTYPCNRGLRLCLYGAIYRLNSFVSMLHYCANLKVIRYELTSLDRIVADKSCSRRLRNTEFQSKSV